MSSLRSGRQPHHDPGADFHEDDYLSTSRRQAMIPYLCITLPLGKSAESASIADVAAVVAPAVDALGAAEHPDLRALLARGRYLAEALPPGHDGSVVPRIRERAARRADAEEKEALGFRDANSSPWAYRG